MILSFVLTPGLLRATMTVGPFMFLLIFPLSGLAILVHVFVNCTEQSIRQLRANAVMGTINGVRGEHEAAERYLRRAIGLSKAHLQEIEVLGK